MRSRETSVRSRETSVRSRETSVRSRETGVRSRETGVRSRETGVRSRDSVMNADKPRSLKLKNGFTCSPVRVDSLLRKRAIAASFQLDNCWFCGRPMVPGR